MPAPSAAAQTILRRAFVDITRGYSVGTYAGAAIYVRHLGHSHHQEYDLLQEQFEERAVAKGALSETDKLALLIERKLWSVEREKEIARQRANILYMEDGKKNIPQPSILRSVEAQIAEEHVKLVAMLTDRAEVLGMTKEVYAQRLLNDHYIVTNVFSDRAMTIPLLGIVTFDNLEDSEVEAVLKAYHTTIEPCGDANLRRLACADFFTSYYNLAQDNAQAFFGRAVCDLTYYQVRTANIASYFKAVMSGMDFTKLEPAVRGDPDAIERLYLAKAKLAEMEQDGKLPTNLSTSDIKELNLKGKVDYVTKELSGADLVKHLQQNHRTR